MEGFLYLVLVIVVILCIDQMLGGGKSNGRKIICSNQNCKYVGRSNKKARGSLLIGLLLCCFFLLPGLIYFMFKGGYRYYCPNCGLQVGVDN